MVASKKRSPLAAFLLKRRCSLRLTQEEVAELCGVGKSAVSKWEAGIAAPKRTRIPTVARVLRCSVGKLYGTGLT